MHLGRTSRALSQLELEATRVRATCPLAEVGVAQAAQVEMLAERLRRTEEMMEEMRAKMMTVQGGQ